MTRKLQELRLNNKLPLKVPRDCKLRKKLTWLRRWLRRSRLPESQLS